MSSVQCWAKRPFFNDLFIGKEKAATIDHQKREKENLLNVWRFSAIIGPLSAASIVGPNVRVCVTDHQTLYKVIAVAVQTVHDVEKKLVSYFIGLVLFFFFYDWTATRNRQLKHQPTDGLPLFTGKFKNVLKIGVWTSPSLSSVPFHIAAFEKKKVKRF